MRYLLSPLRFPLSGYTERQRAPGFVPVIMHCKLNPFSFTMMAD